MEEGRNDFALKRQLTTAERRTALKFDGHDMIGWMFLTDQQLINQWGAEREMARDVNE